MGKLGRFSLNVLIWLDEGLSVLTLGDPHETISSRVGKAQRGDSGPAWRVVTAPLRWAIDFVALHCFGDPNHCANSILPDIGGEAVFTNDGQV